MEANGDLIRHRRIESPVHAWNLGKGVGRRQLNGDRVEEGVLAVATLGMTWLIVFLLGRAMQGYAVIGF
ncbi:MAG: hypothetical protein AB1640_16985 [bacterium]